MVTIFSSLRNFCIALHNGCTYLPPHQQYKRIPWTLHTLSSIYCLWIFLILAIWLVWGDTHWSFDFDWTYCSVSVLILNIFHVPWYHEYDVSCGCHMWPLLCWGMFPLYPYLLESIYHKWVVNFVKTLFCIYWDYRIF